MADWMKQFQQIKMDKPQVNIKRPLPVKPKEQSSNERHDKKAKESGFAIGVSGELYTLSVSNRSSVYIEKIGDEWEAWRETYQTGRQKAISTKTIAKGRTLDYVLMKAKGYLKFLESKRRG